MKLDGIPRLLVALALLWPATSVFATGPTPSEDSPPGTANCTFVRGFCQIRIQDPVARRIPRDRVLPSGPGRGLVPPEVYAEALAGRPVSITRMSFAPDDQGMRATIEWR
jgi:hypothetical protein